jgi:hypothetical protein
MLAEEAGPMVVALLLLACRGEGHHRGDCRDRADNDGDRLVDCADPSCAMTEHCQRGGRRDTSDTFFDTFDFDFDTGGPVPAITYNWDVDGLVVSIDNLRGSGFDLGIAETDAGELGWFGEDCFNGTAGFALCHSFSGSAGTLAALGDGSDPGDPDDVVAGSTTLLNQDLAFEPNGADRLTYMITVDSGACMVWGDDVGYYAPFACTEFQ